MDKIVDLKQELSLVPQYVNLRNRFTEQLLTDIVKLEETVNWLNTSEIEIRGIVKKNELEGVVILYLSRNGEVAVFSSGKTSGIGTQLLNIINSVAVEKGLNQIWAWVRNDNVPAIELFKKCGYATSSQVVRKFKNNSVMGTEFKKCILIESMKPEESF